MKKKLIITENQLERLISQIQDKEILEEGWKEIVLGIGLLAGINLGGYNTMAQDGLKNEKTINAINNVLQSNQLDNVIDSLESIGVKNAETIIYNNSENIKDKLENKYNTKTVTTNDYKKLRTKLRQGYAISDISQDTIKKIIKTKFPQTPVVDSLTIVSDAKDYFGSGVYILTNHGKNEIKSILDEIKNQDGVIIGIRIESSTDKQRVSKKLNNKFKELGYPQNNEGLSKLRNDQIHNFLTKLNINPELIKQTYKWDEGKGEMNASTPQDPTARYVKIYIDVIKVIDDVPEPVEIETMEDVIIYNFELVSLDTKSDKSTNVRKHKPIIIKNKKIKKTKCSHSCPSF
jgi:hypothetical protein